MSSGCSCFSSLQKMSDIKGFKEIVGAMPLKHLKHTYVHKHTYRDLKRNAIFKYLFFWNGKFLHISHCEHCMSSVIQEHRHVCTNWLNLVPDLHLVLTQTRGANVNSSMLMRACALAYPCSLRLRTCKYMHQGCTWNTLHISAAIKLYGRSWNASS